jgi:hypothetical protein
MLHLQLLIWECRLLILVGMTLQKCAKGLGWFVDRMQEQISQKLTKL